MLPAPEIHWATRFSPDATEATLLPRSASVLRVLAVVDAAAAESGAPPGHLPLPALAGAGLPQQLHRVLLGQPPQVDADLPHLLVHGRNVRQVQAEVAQLGRLSQCLKPEEI